MSANSFRVSTSDRSGIEWTRIANDVNGNPRYVVITDLVDGIHFVECVYQLVKARRGLNPVRRKVFPSSQTPTHVMAILEGMGANSRGVIARTGASA